MIGVMKLLSADYPFLTADERARAARAVEKGST